MFTLDLGGYQFAAVHTEREERVLRTDHRVNKKKCGSNRKPTYTRTECAVSFLGIYRI